jgi:hypothetical protein
MFDRSAPNERPVEFALQASLREADGFYRVSETVVEGVK